MAMRVIFRLLTVLLLIVPCISMTWIVKFMRYVAALV